MDRAMTGSSTGSGVTFDATDDALVQCPYDRYRTMRDDAPVLELDGDAFGRPGERIFAVSRHEDVSACCTTPPRSRRDSELPRQSRRPN